MSGKLDERLLAVAQMIQDVQPRVHADIGSDHGHLLSSLLRSGTIEYGIAIENKAKPFQNSVRTLKGLAAKVRLGDGLGPLKTGEADSLSICGLGAESIRDILMAHPDRIPDSLLLQVFHKAEVIRRWALENRFFLVDEQVTTGRRPYTIFSFRRAENPAAKDPAYEGVDRDLALLFGPFVLNQMGQQFDRQLQVEEAWWRKFDRLSEERAQRLQLLRRVMADRKIEPLPIQDLRRSPQSRSSQSHRIPT